MKSQRTCIIGMLVLRQAIDSGWKGGMSPQDIVASNGWAFGVKGITVRPAFGLPCHALSLRPCSWQCGFVRLGVQLSKSISIEL